MSAYLRRVINDLAVWAVTMSRRILCSFSLSAWYCLSISCFLSWNNTNRHHAVTLNRTRDIRALDGGGIPTFQPSPPRCLVLTLPSSPRCPAADGPSPPASNIQDKNRHKVCVTTAHTPPAATHSLRTTVWLLSFSVWLQMTSPQQDDSAHI